MMKINVGLCRKIGEANNGSRGATVNLELELDSSLVGEPAKLKERIRQLFALVRTSLAEELNGGNANGHAQLSNGDSQPPNSQNGNGNVNGHSPGAQRWPAAGHAVPGKGHLRHRPRPADQRRAVPAGSLPGGAPR